jgi:hypothetical protein
MALLDGSQVTELWRSGIAEQFMLFAVKKVTTGDTMDLGLYFRVVMQVAFIGATVSGIAQGTINGTTVTAPAGLTNAGAYMFVQGVAV